MPTIRIDDQVYSWLKSKAVPFEDSPNSVLRRLAGLNPPRNDRERPPSIQDRRREAVSEITPTPRTRTVGRLTGKVLNERWNVGAVHALYHRGGTFYENLHAFPGALFDPNGYVLFNTEQEYHNCAGLSIGQKLNIHHGISSLPGYRRRK